MPESSHGHDTPRESMIWPSAKEWDSLVPVERFELAAQLVVEARQRRAPDAQFTTPNERMALGYFQRGLTELGYEIIADTRIRWKRNGLQA